MPKYTHFLTLLPHNIVILSVFGIFLPDCVIQLSCFAVFVPILRTFFNILVLDKSAEIFLRYYNKNTTFCIGESEAVEKRTSLFLKLLP